MDNYLFANSLNSSPNKLTKAASFSELSMTRKVTTEENYGNLVKQYSCEEIYDHNSSTRQLRISHKLKSNNEEHNSTKIITFPTNSSSKMYNNSSKNKTVFLEESFSFSKPVRKASNNRSSKLILAPPKFIVDGSKSEVSSVNDSKGIVNHTALVNDQHDESDFYFKVPLPPVKKSILNNDIDKNETFTEERVIKNDENEHTEEKTVDTTDLKKRLRNLVRIEPKERKNFRWSSKFIVLLSVLAVSVAYFFSTANLSEKFCNPRFEFRGISRDLKNRIYNQETVIDEFTKYFKDKNNKTDFDVIALVGGIGVGKSYTAEIIKNNMKATSNTVDVFPPLINKEDESYASLSMCRCNLVRIENLKTDDIPDAAAFTDKLKKKAQDYCVLVIALFNTQEADEYLRKTLDLKKSTSLIQQAFGDRKLKPTLISYRSMSKEALTKCIKDAADYSNVQLTNTDVENILHDLSLADNGCKGVYAKVQLQSSSKL